MALKLLVFATCYDNQKRTRTFEFYAPAPASFGAAVDLPTDAHIKAVLNAMIASDMTGLSDAKVLDYGVKVIQEDVTGITQGTGGTSTTQAWRSRYGVGANGPLDRFGVPEGFILNIPCASQDGSLFDPSNRNAAVISGNWITLNTALRAIGFTDEHGNPYVAPSDPIQSATYFDGKRGALRPR
jgi:hypothetical protein